LGVRARNDPCGDAAGLTSAIASLTLSSERVSRITRVLPAPCSSQTSRRSVRAEPVGEVELLVVDVDGDHAAAGDRGALDREMGRAPLRRLLALRVNHRTARVRRGQPRQFAA
jgi:hypothetical protein